MMTARIVPAIDLTAFDSQLLGLAGRMRLRSADELKDMGIDPIGTWCVKRARYGLVTRELVEFLWHEILASLNGPEDVLEICAGMGDLGHQLKIHMTDSAMQTDPLMQAHYAVLRQAICDPPPDVERIDAVAAIKKYKPRIVIGSWVTQLFRDGDTQASVYGVDEEWILDNVDAYIHVGNDSVHGMKRILQRDHQVIYAEWLVSRAGDQSKNCIRIWRRSA